jgi:hypothetical protein
VTRRRIVVIILGLPAPVALRMPRCPLIPGCPHAASMPRAETLHVRSPWSPADEDRAISILGSRVARGAATLETLNHPHEKDAKRTWEAKRRFQGPLNPGPSASKPVRVQLVWGT